MKFLPGEYYLILFDDFVVKDWGDVSKKTLASTVNGAVPGCLEIKADTMTFVSMTA